VVARLRLLGKIAMRAQAGFFDHAAQRFLAPAAAGLIGFEHRPKLRRLRRERQARLRQCFQLFFHFAQRRSLRGFILLQTLLVSVQLLLERFDQTFDRFLPLRQVAFRGFLKFSKRLFRQPQKFRRGLL